MQVMIAKKNALQNIETTLYLSYQTETRTSANVKLSKLQSNYLLHNLLNQSA